MKPLFLYQSASSLAPQHHTIQGLGPRHSSLNRRHPSSSSSTTSRLMALPPSLMNDAFISASSSTSTEVQQMATSASSSGVVFEPRIDVGALVGLLAIAFTVVVFWLRVFVAITDREKREKMEELQKDIYLKRVTGSLAQGEDDALRKAEDEYNNQPALGPVGAFLRRFRLVGTESRQNKDNSNNQDPPSL